MGKAKKGKRNDKDNDFSNSESDGDDVTSITESLKELKVDKKISKKDKKSKQAQAESDSQSDTENVKKQKTKKGKKKGSFDSDDDFEDDKSKSKTKQKKGRKNQDDDSDDEEMDKAKGKVKQKKGKKNKEESDEDEPKVKEKKGKKGKKGADSDVESDEDKKSKGKKKGKKEDEESDDESMKSKPKKGGKKGKKGDDEEDKPKKGKKKKADDSDDDDDDFGIVSSKPAVRGGAPKGGFALLDVEGDDNENDLSDQMDIDDDEDEKPVSMDRNKKGKNQKQETQEPQGKKGKKGKDRKKRHDSDDDIEKVLAELEMEYSGQKKEEPAEVNEPKPESREEEPVKEKKKDKKEKPKVAEVKAVKEEKDEEGDEAGGTMKTAAQKKKEKKEREKAKKMAQKKAEAAKKGQGGEAPKEEPAEKVEKPVEQEGSDGEADAEEGDGKKKKKKKGEKEDEKKGKGPGKKTIVAMQEALKKMKEEEERLKREEEERILQEELQEQARLEQLRLEQEKKDKKKLKEKQRKERLKAEGKLLTNKQKQDRARAQDLINSLKAQGVSLPGVGEKIVRPGTRIKPKKQTQNDEAKVEKKNDQNEQVELKIVDNTQKVEEDKKEDEVKDSWDAESSDDEDKSEETTQQVKVGKPKPSPPAPAAQPAKKVATKEPSVSESESESASETSTDSSSEEESEDEKMTDAERKRERARQRIQTRRIEAQKKKTLDDLRAAVVCVLGHVDTGKTKILDKLRRTNVQDSEAGGITQQIGATNVPIDAIKESTKHVKNFADKKFKIPGLLIIDTPGHESFSNLRNRGSSLCDIAILVVDIMHGLEPQTIESLNLLKKKKCPFVVALNKIDRLYDWQTMNRKDVQDIIKAQAPNTQREFEKRAKEVVLQFNEQGLNAAIYYENPNPRNYVSLVPTSAITGEGMGNLLALIVDACQGPLAKELMFSEELQAIVLEVKALPGLGTTIDCILVNGTLREGDTMIVAGTDGPIVTQIRSLLMPQPLKELRVKNAYIEYREVRAAQGVKIAAKDLEKAIAGLNLQVAQKPDEVEILKEEIAKELTSALGNIKLAERGVYVQASTLGALEALLDFLKTSKIPYAGIRIGPVVKKDVMKASIMLEHDSQYATILAFDVKIERDAQELADAQGVKIFQADIIYHLFDKFTAYREELRQRKRDEFKHIAVFPCKLKILPQFIFNSRDPIIMGVMVESGIVKEGTPLCVPSREFVDLGVVTSIEYNHKPVESARKGQEVCVKIESVPGEAPKMFGRHFDEKDFIVSKISRQSIDACKEYFRDDLVKTDWQLMLELKKLFQIL